MFGTLMFTLMFPPSISPPPGECGSLGGVPLLRLWPRLVFMLPRPDNSAARAALHQAFCGRCLYLLNPQEPEEWISEEDPVPGAGHPRHCPSLQPWAPQAPQSCLRRSPKLQWRKLQARRTREWCQPAGEWGEWAWRGDKCGKWGTQVWGKRVSF